VKISIITVCYNNATTIRDTIASVLSQTEKEIEYIIIDGGSTDGTVEIIKEFAGKLAYWVSEKDGGIYEAMNKGIAKATGDIIGTLNADDFYVSSNVLTLVAQAFMEKKCDVLWGNIYYVSKKNPEIIRRKWISESYASGKFQRGWAPPHTAFFVSHAIYEKYGSFNTKFRIAADYELILRFLEKHKVSSVYVPEFFIKMRLGGESNKTFFHMLRANWETYCAWRENKLRVNIFVLAWKPFSKIIQLFQK
jgi:glycosyltransferase